MNRKRYQKCFICYGLFVGVFLSNNSLVLGQLAITEVMSSASFKLGNQEVVQGPDFWELTNYGDVTMDLTGHRFSDDRILSNDPNAEDAILFRGVSIGPGESIIFFRSSPEWNDAEQFREWWGRDRLPPQLQIYSYSAPGFSSSGDWVQLWRESPSGTELVDQVIFPEATPGSTFISDPNSGVFGLVSSLGEERAFKALMADDVGSPGYAGDSIPLSLRVPISDMTVQAGKELNFLVSANGLPRPRFQWKRNGEIIPGATQNSFSIQYVDIEDAGFYSLELDNGIMTFNSQNAEVKVLVIMEPPAIVQVPEDRIVSPGQMAEFEVVASGYPLPTYQWQFNGVDIPMATFRTYAVDSADETHSGVYGVVIKNDLGSVTVSATLQVRPKPKLVITEMMGSRSTNSVISGRGDWWELTNMDRESVDLKGYRFDGNPTILENATVITNSIIIQAGESVLFLNSMRSDTFKQWWGEEFLPENVQFIEYGGGGIAAAGDSITLWNPAAKDPLDFVARAEYVHLNPDFTPVQGVSLTFWCEGFQEFGVPSVVGECGAIMALASSDIASPGYITNHPVFLRDFGIAKGPGGVFLNWNAKPGRTYQLMGKGSLKDLNWVPLGQYSVLDEMEMNVEGLFPDGNNMFIRLGVSFEQSP